MTIDLTVAGTRWWVVHAGIPADIDFAGVTLDEVVPTLARQRTADLLWRGNDPDGMVPLGRPLIMGHQPHRAPLDTGDVIAIDTGAGKPGGRLTAVVLPDRRFVTVDGRGPRGRRKTCARTSRSTETDHTPGDPRMSSDIAAGGARQESSAEPRSRDRGAGWGVRSATSVLGWTRLEIRIQVATKTDASRPLTP